MRQRQARMSIALLVAVVLIGVGYSPIAAQPAGGPTSVNVYAAFGAGGLRPGATVINRVSGECFAASLADQTRPDAWRCMNGNRILDPCFAGFRGSQEIVACPESPWTSRVTLITPTKAPASASANKPNVGGGLPWALELSSGARCVFLTGGTAAVAGMRINYGCTSTARAESVVGDVDRSLARWRVFVVPGSGVAVQLQTVAVAWY